MIFALILKVVIALAILYFGAGLFRISSLVWRRPLDGTAAPARSLTSSINKTWFMLNISWLLCCICLAVLVLVLAKPSLAVPLLIAFPITTAIIYIATKFLIKPRSE